MSSTYEWKDGQPIVVEFAITLTQPWASLMEWGAKVIETRGRRTNPDMSNQGWIGVDLDGTLAQYDGWKDASHIGEPVPLMLERVKQWLSEGREVRIFTARVTQSTERPRDVAEVERFVQDWTEKHLGVRLAVTNVKDHGMRELWDDRAIHIVANTGQQYHEFWESGEVERLKKLINSPELEDFLKGVSLEVAHQVERWGDAHDREKSAEHWFWLVGYLAGKALRAAINGDREKGLHHCISSAAALLNWHSAIKQDTTGKGIGKDADLEAINQGESR